MRFLALETGKGKRSHGSDGRNSAGRIRRSHCWITTTLHTVRESTTVGSQWHAGKVQGPDERPRYAQNGLFYIRHTKLHVRPAELPCGDSCSSAFNV